MMDFFKVLSLNMEYIWYFYRMMQIIGFYQMQVLALLTCGRWIVSYHSYFRKILLFFDFDNARQNASFLDSKQQLVSSGMGWTYLARSLELQMAVLGHILLHLAWLMYQQLVTPH